MKPLAIKAYDPATLVREFPPQLSHENLRVVYTIADAAHATYASPITYSRWSAINLPAKPPADHATAFEARPDFFTYDQPAAGTIDWHLNFAHHDLFAFYGSGLFAQDEMQVAEHPILASLREALLHDKLSTLTVDGPNITPILIQGAQRSLRIATDPNAAEGRPTGLYGNAFARARPDVIQRATTKLDPPTTSNIIAIEAPAGGRGDYTADQVRYILTTAYTGFRAASLESQAPGKPPPHITIHTGFWGCGAYGGNRLLMTILQLRAAQLAGIDRVVYHTGDKEGLAQYREAEAMLQKFSTEAPATDAFIARLVRVGFRWGDSDGN